MGPNEHVRGSSLPADWICDPRDTRPPHRARPVLDAMSDQIGAGRVLPRAWRSDRRDVRRVGGDVNTEVRITTGDDHVLNLHSCCWHTCARGEYASPADESHAPSAPISGLAARVVPGLRSAPGVLRSAGESRERGAPLMGASLLRSCPAVVARCVSLGCWRGRCLRSANVARVNRTGVRLSADTCIPLPVSRARRTGVRRTGVRRTGVRSERGLQCDPPPPTPPLSPIRVTPERVNGQSTSLTRRSVLSSPHSGRRGTVRDGAASGVVSVCFSVSTEERPQGQRAGKV